MHADADLLELLDQPRENACGILQTVAVEVTIRGGSCADGIVKEFDLRPVGLLNESAAVARGRPVVPKQGRRESGNACPWALRRVAEIHRDGRDVRTGRLQAVE